MQQFSNVHFWPQKGRWQRPRILFFILKKYGKLSLKQQQLFPFPVGCHRDSSRYCYLSVNAALLAKCRTLPVAATLNILLMGSEVWNIHNP